MPRLTKAKEKKVAKIYAEAILDGESQCKAYRKAFPKAKESTVQGNASNYNKKPLVMQYIEEGLALISERDTKTIVSNVIKDAKQSHKEVIVDGQTVRIKDNQNTTANRDLFFKLAGHPAFTKQINITNNNVSLDNSTAELLTQALDRVAQRRSTNGVTPAQFVDVDYTPEDS